MALTSTPAPHLSRQPRTSRSLAIGIVLLGLFAAGCSGGSGDSTGELPAEANQLADAARRYGAEWLIDTTALELVPQLENVSSPFLYREVVDDLTGTFLVESPNHLVLQTPDSVLLCAAINRVPQNPFCATTPRAEGTPHVLSYPIQLVQGDWSPRALYDLAGYREVSLVAASDPDSWSVQKTTSSIGFPIECFLAIGETTAATTGFEICFTNDDLHLVASVDLQNDLIFEIELLSYERVAIADDFEVGLDGFIEERPLLHQQLLDLYPEVPAPRPTPTPNSEG